MPEVTHRFDKLSTAVTVPRELTLDLVCHQVLLEASITAKILICSWISLCMDIGHTKEFVTIPTTFLAVRVCRVIVCIFILCLANTRGF